MYLARVLGTEQFGAYSWVMAIYAYAYMMANFGFETHGTRTIAQKVSNDFLSGIFVLRFGYVSISLAVIILLNIFILPKFNSLLMLQSVSLLLLPFNTQYIFRGLNKAKYDGLSRTIQAGLFFLLVYSFVEAGRMMLLPIVWFISSAAALASFYILMTKMLSYTFAVPSAASIKTILRGSLPVGIASALILLYLNFNTILLGVYVDNKSVGIFSAAFKIYYLGYSLLALYYMAFLPSLSKQDGTRFHIMKRNYIRLLYFMAVVLVLTGIFLSEFIILLLFGHHYETSIPVMKILFFSLAASCLTFAYMNPLQAIGRDALFIKLLLLRTVIFAALCFLLIPRYGFMGAAYATLAAECITIPVSIYLFNTAFIKHLS